jgi:hypothetical protein
MNLKKNCNQLVQFFSDFSAQVERRKVYKKAINEKHAEINEVIDKLDQIEQSKKLLEYQ